MADYGGKCEKPVVFSQGIAPTSARQTHVAEQFGLLRQAVECYDDLVQRLDSCLQPILSNLGPAKEQITDAKVDREIVPLAHEIRLVTGYISKNNRFLDNLISRIEV